MLFRSRRDYDALVFEKRGRTVVPLPSAGPAAPQPPARDRADAPLEVPGETRWGDWVLRADVDERRGDAREAMRALIHELKKTAPENVQYLDLDRAKCDNLVVRSRRPGDRFTPLGAPGHTKLKDFLIRRKVPHAERDRLPLVVAGGRIVAVARLAVSDDAALTEHTTRVLKITTTPAP